jgi:hypothetical protein
MIPSIIFKTDNIQNYNSLFHDFGEDFLAIHLEKIQSREKITLQSEHPFDLDLHDKLNETYLVLSDLYIKNTQLEFEVEKNKILRSLTNKFGQKYFLRYVEFLDRKINRLTDNIRKNEQSNIAILFREGYDDILICDTQDRGFDSKIENLLKSYLHEYFEEKIEDCESLFSSDSLWQLKNQGIEISSIVEEINEEKQLEFENELLNECWQIEYEVHLPIYDQERLDELINNEESSLSGFEILENKIIWRSRHFEINDNENFSGHYFHPLKKDVQIEIYKQIEIEFRLLLSDYFQSDWFEFSEIMEICDGDYEIKIRYCEFPKIELLTKLSMI